jgi:hypothetical protein
MTQRMLLAGFLAAGISLAGSDAARAARQAPQSPPSKPAPPNKAWQVATPGRERFSVETPAAFSSEVVEFGPKVKGNFYSCTGDGINGNILSVRLDEIPSAPKATLNSWVAAFLPSLVQSAESASGGKMTIGLTREVDLSGYPGREYQGTVSKETAGAVAFARFRFFIVRDVIYVFAAFSFGEESPNLKRFVESVKLIPSKP